MNAKHAPFEPSSAGASIEGRCESPAPKLFELRTYEMHVGRRDDLIDLFETVFFDAYEECGARILATFRDVDVADRWVWIRAFADANERGRALAAFYSSDAWRRLGKRANAAIRDTNNALLLRLSGGAICDADIDWPFDERTGLIVSSVQVAPSVDQSAHAAALANYALPLLRELGGEPFATLESDRSPNSYPRQVVRSQPAFAALTRFRSREEQEEFVRRREASWKWRHEIEPMLSVASPPEIMRLAPTARSRMR